MVCFVCPQLCARTGGSPSLGEGILSRGLLTPRQWSLGYSDSRIPVFLTSIAGHSRDSERIWELRCSGTSCRGPVVTLMPYSTEAWLYGHRNIFQGTRFPFFKGWHRKVTNHWVRMCRQRVASLGTPWVNDLDLRMQSGLNHHVICLSEPRNRRTNENLRWADCEAGKDRLSLPLVSSAGLHLAASLLTTIILPYPGKIAPLQRKNNNSNNKKLEKSTCLLLSVPLCCWHNSPGSTPGASHRPRRSCVGPPSTDGSGQTGCYVWGHDFSVFSPFKSPLSFSKHVKFGILCLLFGLLSVHRLSFLVTGLFHLLNLVFNISGFIWEKLFGLLLLLVCKQKGLWVPVYTHARARFYLLLFFLWSIVN